MAQQHKANDILICGVGGQGTVLASRLIAQAAMGRGQFVRTAETIGMAQRGGCVVSHVRIESQDKGALIPPGGADTLIAFEIAEAVRCLPFLKPGGRVIVNQRTIVPVTSALGAAPYEKEAILASLQAHAPDALFVPADELAQAAGSAKAGNTVLLGACIACGLLDFDLGYMRQVLAQSVPARFKEINLRALESGYQYLQGGR